MKRTRERLERVWAMIQAGIVTREKSCERKAAYPNRNDAIHDAKLVFTRTGRQTAVYRCEFCSQYHITKFKHGEEAA